MSKKFAVTISIAIVCAPLGACWKDQVHSLQYCKSLIKYNSGFPPLAHVQTPMTRCMDRLGYDMAYDNPHCPGAPVPRRSPYCYVPKGALAAAGFRLEMMYQPGSRPPVTHQ